MHLLQGLTSLLATGPLATLPQLAAAAASAATSLPAWMRPPCGSNLQLPQQLLLQRLGLQPPSNARMALPVGVTAGHLQHHVTCRGHNLAVYCVTFDTTGDKVITGADDWLVKVRGLGDGTAGVRAVPLWQLQQQIRSPHCDGVEKHALPWYCFVEAVSSVLSSTAYTLEHLSLSGVQLSCIAVDWCSAADLGCAHRPPAVHLPRPPRGGYRPGCEQGQCTGGISLQ